MTQTVLLGFAAYLLGSISFAVLVSRLMGLPDPRSYGSKNPGATNVLRSGSKLAAILTLLGDTGKGALAVFLAAWVTGEPLRAVDPAIAGALALFGHVYPVFHRFQGGKGVATAAGVLLAIDPILGAGVLAVAAGFWEQEFAFRGVDFERRGKIYGTLVDGVRAAFAGEPFDGEGLHLPEGGRLSPEPFTPGGPPL